MVRVTNVDHARGTARIRRVTPRRWTGRPPGRPKGAKGDARALVTVRLTPEQRAALNRIAEQDRRARGAGRRDVSRLVREAIDLWLRERGE